MPPHCDSLDGPVVQAARRALDAGDVNLALPYVPAEGEDEVRAAFQRALPVRDLGPQAREVADLAFFETVVRIHRAGEGAPYTGLKPAGLSVGPVIPLAERSIEEHSAETLADFLAADLHNELSKRLEAVEQLAVHGKRSLQDERRYVEAMLGFEVYSHHLYQALHAGGHAEGSDHTHVTHAQAG